MRVELMLLPSPLLGAGAWEAADAALRRAGWASKICDTPPDPFTAEDVAEHFLEALPDDRPLVLIPHSNAGLFVSHLCEHRDVVATVFVDAALPPSAGSFPLAPAALISAVASRADEDGRLPPWTEWWDEEDVDALLPSAAARERVEATQPRVSLSYLRSTLHAPPGWNECANAYLAFGDTYASEIEQARRWHWPVEVMTGGHLHMLVQPEQVASQIAGLFARLAAPGVN